MNSLLPTQIDQVNDFTAKASEDYIRALQDGQKGSPLSALSTMLNLATKASESQKLTDTLDAYNRARQAGKSSTEALEGLDPRMTGSKAFGDESKEIDKNIMAKAADARAQAAENRDARSFWQKEESNSLLADLMKQEAEYGEYAVKPWLDAHYDQLKANPLAFSSVMNYAKSKNLSPVSVTSSEALLNSIDQLPQKLSQGDLTTQLKHLQGERSKLIGMGVSTEDPRDEAYAMNLFDNFIKEEAKRRGYEGGAYADFYDNMVNPYKNYLAHAQKWGAGPELAMAALKRTIEDSFWLGTQDKVNESAGIDFIEGRGKTYNDDRATLASIDRLVPILESALKDDKFNKLSANFDTQRAYITQAVKDKVISETDGANALARLLQATTTSAAAINRAMAEAGTITAGKYMKS